MIVWIDTDERYPEFILHKKEDRYGTGELIEIPDELFNKYNKLSKEFDDIQEEIFRFYRKFNNEKMMAVRLAQAKDEE
jgi:hypothetical protein